MRWDTPKPSDTLPAGPDALMNAHPAESGGTICPCNGQLRGPSETEPAQLALIDRLAGQALGRIALSVGWLCFGNEMGSDPSPPRNPTPCSRAPDAGLRRHEKHNRESVDRDDGGHDESDADDARHRIAMSGHLLHRSPARLWKKGKAASARVNCRCGSAGDRSRCRRPRPRALRWEHGPFRGIASSGETWVGI
jgi:hypothetical protein